MLTSCFTEVATIFRDLRNNSIVLYESLFSSYPLQFKNSIKKEGELCQELISTYYTDDVLKFLRSIELELFPKPMGTGNGGVIGIFSDDESP